MRDTRDITVSDITVQAVTADFCSSCGEVILDRIEGDRIGRVLARHKKENPPESGFGV